MSFNFNLDDPQDRPSQIACVVTAVHVTCMQTALRGHENLCTVFK